MNFNTKSPFPKNSVHHRDVSAISDLHKEEGFLQEYEHDSIRS